jgi:hypothetical protein
MKYRVYQSYNPETVQYVADYKLKTLLVKEMKPNTFSGNI